MIKGSLFRGIDYKCAMVYFSNQEWPKAIKEFERITNESDPQIYEMLSKCYQRSGNLAKGKECLDLAIQSYILTGDSEKAERLRAAAAPVQQIAA
jgi:lipopolysaccharide biosynthesis regulator YciM